MKITQVQIRPGNLRPGLSGISLTAITLEPKALGGGGFGTNYICKALDNSSPSVELVIKILKENGQGSIAHARKTVLELMNRLHALDQQRQSRKLPPLHTLPGLLGIPQFWFEGTLNGQKVCGYAAIRLDTMGFTPFDTFVDGTPGPYQAYQNTPVALRLQMAADLAEGLQALREVDFLHGDLNPENLFVNLKTGHAAIIDFDSGAIGGQPTTWGKRTSDWVAPELVQALAASTQPVVTHDSEAWSLAIGVHYLLFQCHPLFYLKDLGAQTLRDYTRRDSWPTIAPLSPLLHPANGPYHARYIAGLVRMPASVRSCFTRLLQKGVFAPAQRPDAALWGQALKGALRAPAIHFFAASQICALPGDSITLLWHVDHAWKVELSGVGDVTGQNQQVITLTKNMTCELVASGAGGTTRRSLQLRMLIPARPILPASIASPALFQLPEVHSELPELQISLPHISLPPLFR